jgi:GNAT superfamily N-acetyltransferase
MFAEYVLEREGGILLKHKHGFAIYKDFNATLGYLQDVYVLPDFRQTGVGQELLQQAIDIAKKSNKIALLTSTDTLANGATESALAILKSGFKVLKTDNSLIWYIMEFK